MQISPENAASALPVFDRSIRSLANGSSADRRRGSRRSVDQKRTLLAALAQSLIDLEHEPVFIVQAPQKVLLMNEAADALLRSTRAIRLRNGALEFTNKGHRAQLAKVLSGEYARLTFNLRVAGSEERLTITRVQLATKATCARISVTSLHGLASRLQAALELTTAEAEIAVSIYQGLSLEQVAHARGSSINTVKTQLRYIFNKTGVRSKAALTRRVGEVSARF